MAQVTHAVRIGADRERVFCALTRAPDLETWWANRCEGMCSAGRELRFTFRDLGRTRGEMEVTVHVERIVEGARVEWIVLDGPARLRGTRVTFEVEDVGDAVRVRVTHAGFAEDDAEVDGTSWRWALYLSRLKMVCEAGEGGGGGRVALPYGEVGVG